LNLDPIKELIVFKTGEGRMSGAREGENDYCDRKRLMESVW